MYSIYIFYISELAPQSRIRGIEWIKTIKRNPYNQSTGLKTADDRDVFPNCDKRSRGRYMMASTDTSTTSSQISAVAADEHKRTVDEAFLNKMKGLVERLRLDNTTLKKSLDIERSEVRALKARHESIIRNLKTEYKKKEEYLEKQLRTSKPEKADTAQITENRLVELKKLTIEIQSLKTANKGLQEKLKVIIFYWIYVAIILWRIQRY